MCQSAPTPSRQKVRGKMYTRVLTGAFHVLRSYSLWSPIERGKTRIEGMIHGLAQALPVGTILTLSARDGRRIEADLSDPQSYMGLLARGGFEPRSSQLVTNILREGNVVVDAGANVGWYTTLFSLLVGRTGMVHAFEPASMTASSLRRNCDLNGCENVVIIQKALGAASGQLALHRPMGGASGDATLFPARDCEAHVEVCDVVSLDAYFRSGALPRCDLLKLDIEGSELSALVGARVVISTFHPLILFESNPATTAKAGYSPWELIAELERYEEYRFFIIEEDPDPKIVRGSRSRNLPTDRYVNVLAVPASRLRTLETVLGLPGVETLSSSGSPEA